MYCILNFSYNLYTRLLLRGKLSHLTTLRFETAFMPIILFRHKVNGMSTFILVKTDLSVSFSEQIDLMITYLGKKSKKQVVALKSAYFHNQEAGLKKDWSRLDERSV